MAILLYERVALKQMNKLVQFPTNQVEGHRLLYARKSAAWELDISIRMVDYLVANKQLGTRRIGKRVMIPYSELVRFARSDHFEPIIKKAA